MNAVRFIARQFSTTQVCQHTSNLTRLRVVDNSSIGKQAMLEGKPPKIIHNHTNRKPRHGKIGDKVTVAIKGLIKRGYLVGITARQPPMWPRTDSNSVVLVDNQDTPLGTRVLVPIPHHLRSKPQLAKVIAISTKFV